MAVVHEVTRGSSDVLVVGAGPAGCAAGITLARAGLSVAVVDRAVFPRAKVCGDALSNSALKLIEALGAGDSLAQRPGATVSGAVAILPDGGRVVRSYGDAPGRIVGRFDLDDVLRRALEQSGARVMEGTHVRALTERDGAVSGAEGDALAWSARAVIAADGPGSVGWSSFGTTYARGRTLALSATAYYRGVVPGTPHDYSEHFFDAEIPCGYGWIFPHVDGTANVGVYQRADVYHAAAVPLATMLEQFLARHAHRFAHAERVGKVRSWSLPLASPWRPAGRPGLLLAGDAGRHVDPLTGEGIWQALRTGVLAGESIATALRTHGQVNRADVLRYQQACFTGVDGAALVRGGVQDAMRVVVGTALHRVRAVRELLQWGYGRGSLEVSKTVGR